MKKLERLESLIGIDNLTLLETKKIVVIGCGGVGGYVVEALVRSNIIDFTLIDYDRVEESNFNRQIIAMDSTIGMLKTEVMKKRMQDINKNCNVVCHTVKLTNDNIETLIPKDASYVIDACDDIRAKESIILYCLTHFIPLISCMGTGKRMDPSKLFITTLDKTKGDPLARVLRHKLKSNKKAMKTLVCTSLELPIKSDKKEIASSIFVPGSAGLLIASKVISDLLEDKNDNNFKQKREETSCSLL